MWHGITMILTFYRKTLFLLETFEDSCKRLYRNLHDCSCTKIYKVDVSVPLPFNNHEHSYNF